MSPNAFYHNNNNNNDSSLQETSVIHEHCTQSRTPEREAKTWTPLTPSTPVSSN